MSNFPCIEERNDPLNISVATQKSAFATQHSVCIQLSCLNIFAMQNCWMNCFLNSTYAMYVCDMKQQIGIEVQVVYCPQMLFLLELCIGDQEVITLTQKSAGVRQHCSCQQVAMIGLVESL